MDEWINFIDSEMLLPGNILDEGALKMSNYTCLSLNQSCNERLQLFPKRKKYILMFLESLEHSAKSVNHIRPGIEIVWGMTKGVGLRSAI